MGAGNRNVVGGRYGALTAAVLMVGATAVVMANVLLAPSPTDVRGQGAPVATPRHVTTASTSPATISAAITSAATSTAPVTGSARPRDRHRIPSAALVRLRTDVRGLTEPRPGRPTALRARLVAYHIDNWHSADDFTLLVSWTCTSRQAPG